MDDELTISTPEQVGFYFELAGIGSRFLAALLDHLILGTALVLMICALSFVGTLAQLSSMADQASGAVVWLIAAITLLLFFGSFWGYFVFFEIVWRGSTPGKRICKLRVLRSNGEPIGGGEAVLRNLVRIVDLLPGFYAIGLTAMFVDRHARRLGDMAAGTIVVREGDLVALRNVRVGPRGYVTPAPATGPITAASLRSREPAYSFSAPTHDPLPGISLDTLSSEDYRLMRELLERVGRGELQWQRGHQIGTRLAYGLAARMGQDFAYWQRQGWDPLVFLNSVLASRDFRAQAAGGWQ